MIFRSSGQGLLETIIAIGIVVTGLVGAISLVNFTLRSSSSTVSRMVALNLAMEGVEVAVNFRDSNYLAVANFDDVLNGGSDTTAVFDFDETQNIWFVDFAPETFADLETQLFQKGGVYRQGFAVAPSDRVPTNFRRLITLDNTVEDQIRVVSTVQWTERQNTNEISVERTLFNWR